MIHLGDITQIHGYDVPIVDIVCGGSPCQDLSVAGKRAGLAGERSGLFMEQIRIIKEMRDESARQLQLRGANEPIRPRYMVWENVPGAFSSNKGEDFRAVLEETAKVAERDACIPRFEGGRWPSAGCIMGDGWSIAWRVHDAQFWGVPQRRKRIALVADFRGDTAPEILFERKGLSGDTQESGKEGQEVAGTVGDGTYQTGTVAYAMRERGGVERDCYGKKAGKGALIQNNKTGALSASQDQTLFVIEGNGARPSHRGDGFAESEISYTLNAVEQHAVAYDGSNITCPTNASNPKDGDPCHTLTGDSRNYAVINSAWDGSQVSPTLTANNAGGNQRMPDKDNFNAVITYQDTTGALCASGYNKLGVQEAANDMYVVESMEVYHCNTDTEKAQTLKARDYKDPQVVYGLDRASFNQGQNAQYDFAIDQEKIGTQVAKGPGAVCTSIVRRLTPMECERLQGYPDHWTDIGEWVDSKGKKHKNADSPRYKALGNSIALPFWQWMAQKMCSYIEKPQMASLFDGIGGFPLVFSRCGCKPIWASEIEEFPIAVTKIRFLE